MYYLDQNGRRILDSSAGLWCCNAGHCRASIVKAIQDTAASLDFAPSFQFGHPKAFEAAAKIAALAPGDLNHVFFANSGSEAADTAVKIAVAWHRVRGEGTRTRIIGRERGYHGVGMAGISAGGLVNNRKWFNGLAFQTDHLPATYDRARQAFANGQPHWGAHLADELEKLVGLHDASTIAAVIVEPMAGSTGVLPPPVGYLEKLRAITARHGILLIFDEVVTGFGRLGAAFAAERFCVVPDIITFAKGVTSGTVPMGGAIVDRRIYDAFMTGPDHAIDLFHGYTYSGHPLAAAAACATIDLYRDEGLFQRAAELEPYFAAAAAQPQGPAARRRYKEHRPRGGDRSGSDRGRAGQARLRNDEDHVLREERDDPHVGRLHRLFSAVDRRENPYRRDIRKTRRRPSGPVNRHRLTAI